MLNPRSLMEHFVTLFDSLFLPQGLALHSSLERHVINFKLWILCIDDEAFDALREINLPNVQLLKLSELETKELKKVKTERTSGEFCWTTTPFTPKFVFDYDKSVNRVTYLDADLWFMKNPKPIFEEFEKSGKNILITEHAFSPEYDLSQKTGKYCVQYITFVRGGSDIVRKWWEERCIEWCYARFENGKFGDQKYLDYWPELFPQHVHILSNKEWALAPWNASRFPYSDGIFWHFHELRIFENRSKSMVQFVTSYSIPPITREQIYKPYIQDINAAIKIMKNNGIELKPQQKFRRFSKIRGLFKGIRDQIWRINHELFSNLN